MCELKNRHTEMRRYKTGKDRLQSTLFPPTLNDYINENNPIRAIDAYVDNLDLESIGFNKTQVIYRRNSGQPAYSPGALLKLYLYGYLNRIHTSRYLAKECHRNLEVIWLLEDIKPSYKTIADFRKENGDALRKTHAEFILLCRELSLFGGKQIAVDGSFFEGNVSKKSFITSKSLNQQILQLENQISQWLSDMDASDKKEAEVSTASEDRHLADKLEKLQKLQAKRTEKVAQKQALEEAGIKQLSMVDKDAKLLNKRGGCIAGYNVQIAIDSKHKLIVADNVVSDSNDMQQLHPMAKKAKNTLAVSTLDVLGDAGYFTGRQIAACLEDNITPYVPVPDKKSYGNHSDRVSRNQFIYDKENDCFYCPLKQELKKIGQPQQANGTLTQRYRSSVSTCSSCELREKCVSDNSKYREIWRQQDEDIVSEHQKRMRDNPDIMRKRCGLVEHPFGTLKCRAGWNHFLVRGIDKVRGEWSLMALAYNFTRVLNILGVDEFKKVCTR